MFKISLVVAAVSLLFALPASAADFSFTGEVPQVAPIAQAHLICDDDGNCYRTHSPRYVERWHDDDEVYERPGYPSRYVAPGTGGYRDFDDGPAIDVDVDDGTW